MALPIIESPKYETKIPSTGKKIFYRPYLVREEKVLMLALESEDQSQIMQAMKDIVKACTFDKVEPDKLCVFDLEFLFLKLRSKSVGEISKVGLKCEKCTKPTDVEINLETVDVNMVNRASNKIKLTDTIGVIMTWPKVNAVSKLEAKQSGIDNALDVIVSCIDAVYDDKKSYPSDEQSHEDMIKFLESLNQSQFAKIQAFVEDMPRLQHEVSFTCANKECGHGNKLTITGLQSFFA